MKALIGLASLLACGALFVGLNAGKLGLSCDGVVQTAKTRVDAIASEAIPEIQLEILVAQMRNMCPVRFDDQLTLVEVSSDEDLRVHARYQLSIQSTLISLRDQAGYRHLAIEQFRETGISQLAIASKIRWHFIFETAAGRPLFDLHVEPQEFVGDLDDPIDHSPQQATSQQFTPPDAPARNSKSHRIEAVPLSQVHDIFYASASEMDAGRRTIRQGTATRNRSSSGVQVNPFAK